MKESAMGDVYVELENYADGVLAEEGYLDRGKVRSQKIKVLADSGSTMLVLPQELVDSLGLKHRGKRSLSPMLMHEKSSEIPLG